ncbi:MAG: hypothetical protein HZA10_04645 [Nitrospirae bacterium]|nr:hypothetical protein [Nitrospirota bacterium]
MMKTRSLLIALAVCLALASIVYSSSIVNSKHDLSSGFSWAGFNHVPTRYNQFNEVCVYCHTPHSSGTIAPLWNKNTPAGPYNIYTSSTMDSTVGNPPGGISLACLSCHDGVQAVDSIINAPGSGLGVPTTPSANHRRMSVTIDVTTCAQCHSPSGSAADHTTAYLGVDLSDDHPISMTYPATSDFNAPTDAQKGWGGSAANDIKLYGGKVECASCHNVHDPAVVPFLRISNTDSALCTKCHVK